MLATTTAFPYALVVAVFLAALVEMVEALTIVVAVGHARSWRSALEGTGLALACLAVLVAIVGPAISHVPLTPLRVVVGAVLLVFGLQWLRKAILRASGHKALHDEDEIYRATVAELRAAGEPVGRDRLAVVTSFKGVFLEGLEVVIMVVTLGARRHQILIATASAATATVLVAIVGAIVAKQLNNVPENFMKATVGVLLVSYGVFWSGEGVGVRWPHGDVMLLAIAALTAAGVGVQIQVARR